MSFKDTKILELNNQFHNSDKTPSIIYADLESLIEQNDECENSPEQQYTTKVNISRQVFHCLQYCHLKIRKLSIMYAEVTIARKDFMNP